MLIPIRCFTCGKVLPSLWDKYSTLVSAGMPVKDAYAEVGLKRYCCKRMFLSHVSLIDELLKHDDIDHSLIQGVEIRRRASSTQPRAEPLVRLQDPLVEDMACLAIKG